MIKHTPGPWGVESTEHIHWVGPMRSDGIKVREIVAILHCDPCYKPEKNIKSLANARLIAAAPDMYEALQDALSFIYLLPQLEGETTRKAEKALAKARGES